MSQLEWYRNTLRQYLKPDEIRSLTRISNGRAVFELLYIWMWVAIAFSLVALQPAWYTVLLSLWILGGKQLACAILMHDASHDAFFKGRKLNNLLGNCFGAWPLFADVRAYRPYHRMHHQETGLDSDPDLDLTKGYPAGRMSMLRKFGRDLIGITGLKGQIGIWAMQIGLLEFELGGRIRWKDWRSVPRLQFLGNAIANLSGPIMANACLFAICWLCGKPMLYLLWPAAILTTYPFCLRVRSIAEHSMTENRENPQLNTRTTRANWLERMLFAPLNVNYHAEHHLLMGAPSYQLPRMHKLLVARGFYDRAPLASGYLEVLGRAFGIRTATGYSSKA